MLRTRDQTLSEPAYRLGSAALLGAAATILVALGFEHLGGYKPCPLCLQQRYAYYLAIPLAFVALVALASGRKVLAASLFMLASLAFLGNAALGVYHAGAEWKFWPGPDTCGGALEPLRPLVGDLKREAAATRVIRCDEAPWRLVGLSFAGWNVVVSMLLWITFLQAAFAAPVLGARSAGASR